MALLTRAIPRNSRTCATGGCQATNGMRITKSRSATAAVRSVFRALHQRPRELLVGPRIRHHDRDPSRPVQGERDVQAIGARRLKDDACRPPTPREPAPQLLVPGSVIREACGLELPFIAAHGHVEHVLAYIDPRLRLVAHPPPPILVSRSGPPDPAPCAYRSCGCRVRASDTPRHRRRGRRANLTNKLMAYRRPGLPGTPSSPTP